MSPRELLRTVWRGGGGGKTRGKNERGMKRTIARRFRYIAVGYVSYPGGVGLGARCRVSAPTIFRGVQNRPMRITHVDRRATYVEYARPHTFIDQHQAEVVPRRVLFVDVAEGGCQVKSSKEQTDRDGFTCTGQRRSFRRDRSCTANGAAWVVTDRSIKQNLPLEGEPSMIYDTMLVSNSDVLLRYNHQHVPRSAPASHSRYIG